VYDDQVIPSGAEAARPVVLIPAYQPGEALPGLVRELAASGGFAGIIVVDDGSGDEYRGVFREAAETAGVVALRHAVNLGKGAALRTGLNYAACQFPGSVGVVTADADGQHAVKDILRVAEDLAVSPTRLTLGVRAFDAPTPWRSRIGNTLTRAIMRVVTGQRLTDTQTGLRGVPMSFVPVLLKLRATGYEFELDMLVTARDAGVPIRETPVSTIYIDGNRASHFNPLADSMRVYFVFVRYLAVSLATAGIDNLVFILTMLSWADPLLCQGAARLVAGTFQYTATKRGVFHSHTRTTVAAPRYVLTVVVSGALSYMLIRNLVTHAGFQVIPAKLLAETILFFVNFLVQRDFVFRRKEEPAE
jgi:glycosyltransferase involved in cell wall biosynthesis